MTDTPLLALPNVYTILPGTPFAKALATQLWHEYKDDLPALSDVQIYVPNRRSARAMANMFLEVSDGQATLLPRLTPLGDIDEDDLLDSDPFTLEEDPFLTPAIPPLERQIILSKMILARQDIDLTATEAFNLAGDLSRFIDRAHTEQVDLTKLDQLVIGDLADHWKITCNFLSIIIEHWPKILEARQQIDPAARRNLLLRKKIDALLKNPPQHRVIAAGSTGSISASAQLLNIIARLPNGCVVLPGLDPQTSDAIWDAIDETHPYYYQKQLVMLMDIDRQSIQLWPNTTRTDNEILPLLHYAMQPQSIFNLSDAVIRKDVLNRVELYAAENPLHEAKIIALRLRDVLNDQNKTAMVVTPDRILAQHIQQEMQRWDIQVNDSGGQPLSDTPLGVFMKLVSGLAISPMQATHILAVMRHPFYRFYVAQEQRDHAVHTLEQSLRSMFVPHNDLRLLQMEEPIDILSRTLDVMAPMLQDGKRPLHEWIADHIAAAEALATTPHTSGADALWRHEDGEAASRLLAELYEAASPHEFMLSAADYGHFIHAALDGVTVRPNYGSHPRLTILSNIEARLQHADLVILAGLNETVWPAQVKADTWLSRPMQKEIGFGSPDRRIGQAALDFMTLYALPHVCVTWSKKRDGTAAHPSRWVQQISAVYTKNAVPVLPNTGAFAHWGAIWDRPDTLRPHGTPSFAPPVAARPRRLPVTAIGTWKKDPYALYAQRILHLRPMDALDRQPDARDWGNAAHKILERFIGDNAIQDDDPAARFQAIAVDVMNAYPLNTSQKKAWWSKLDVIRDWFITTEQQNTMQVAVETTMKKSIALTDDMSFELFGRSDRVDTANGTILITDYKTGTLPSEKSIKSGLAPQLPLLGWLHRHDETQDIRLRYIKLSGKTDKPAEEKIYANSAELIDLSFENLMRLLHSYYIDGVAYVAQPIGRNDYDDYRHLKRTSEWAALGDGDGDGGSDDDEFGGGDA